MAYSVEHTKQNKRKTKQKQTEKKNEKRLLFYIFYNSEELFHLIDIFTTLLLYLYPVSEVNQP